MFEFLLLHWNFILFPISSIIQTFSYRIMGLKNDFNIIYYKERKLSSNLVFSNLKIMHVLVLQKFMLQIQVLPTPENFRSNRRSSNKIIRRRQAEKSDIYSKICHLFIQKSSKNCSKCLLDIF